MVITARVAIIGGGAAGYFCAINLAEQRPDLSITIYEASKQCLAKVKVSGGGRCNVTHDCFEAKELVGNYPRGHKALLGPFHQFGPEQLIEWFAQRGVVIRAEADGRMFPESNTSQTIIDCFEDAATAAGVRVEKTTAVKNIIQSDEALLINDGVSVDAIVIATGSSASGHQLAQSLGHHIIDGVPSLFTFKCDAWVHALAGLSVANATVSLIGLSETFEMQGPVLCTHWGVSGPAVLKCSAWAARALHACDYKCAFEINWLPVIDMLAFIDEHRQQHGKKHIINSCPEALPKRLWMALCEQADIDEGNAWSQISKAGRLSLAQTVNACQLQMNGKTTFKEEFVTAGGIDRDEINWKSMQSKLVPRVYFAGECIDVDAVTGGFNFQHAWTSAWLAAQDITRNL